MKKMKQGNQEIKTIYQAQDILRKVLLDYDPPNIHWLSSQETDIDQSEDWCYNCAVKKAEELTIQLKKKVDVDGGWSSQESDTCSHCQDCETQLNYSLTEYGVESELDHFLDEDIKILPLSKEEAYEINEVLGSYNCYDEQKKRVLELAKKVITSVEKKEQKKNDDTKKE